MNRLFRSIYELTMGIFHKDYQILQRIGDLKIMVRISRIVSDSFQLHPRHTDGVIILITYDLIIDSAF